MLFECKLSLLAPVAMASVLDIAGGGFFLSLFITCVVLGWPIAEPFGRSRAPSDGFPSFALISPFFAQALLTCWRRPANILRAPLVCKGSKGFLVVPSFLSPPTQRHGRLGFRIWYRLPNRKRTTVLVGWVSTISPPLFSPIVE